MATRACFLSRIAVALGARLLWTGCTPVGRLLVPSDVELMAFSRWSVLLDSIFRMLCNMCCVTPFGFFFVPAVIFFLQGDVEQLQQWTGEACFNKLSSEAKQRKADGMVLVSMVLVLVRAALCWRGHTCMRIVPSFEVPTRLLRIGTRPQPEVALGNQSQRSLSYL